MIVDVHTHLSTLEQWGPVFTKAFAGAFKSRTIDLAVTPERHWQSMDRVDRAIVPSLHQAGRRGALCPLLACLAMAVHHSVAGGLHLGAAVFERTTVAIRYGADRPRQLVACDWDGFGAVDGRSAGGTMGDRATPRSSLDPMGGLGSYLGMDGGGADCQWTEGRESDSIGGPSRGVCGAIPSSLFGASVGSR